MLRLTPSGLRHIYATLRETMPFRRWSLPRAENVVFGSVTRGNYAGICYHERGGTPIIRINARRNKTLGDVVATMAHEMCHVRQFECGAKDDDAHGPAFKKLAAQVCHHHGFSEWSF